ncbi:adhesion G protein-coupled receptor L4-like [Porites lutea]|uniref:adhesion G protein-coupled receptor L4-like n=1 Tax=Porites lutea TaxID=51062 RepID=UPI003CC50F8A
MKEYANRTLVGVRSLNKTVEQKMEEVLTATLFFEEFALRFGQYHLVNNTAHLSVNSQNIALQVRKGVYDNSSQFDLFEPGGQNYIKIPSEDFSRNGSIFLGVIYKRLQELFLVNQTNTMVNKTSKSLNTMIMSATIDPHPSTLQRNVTLVFSNVMKATRKRECVFWNFLEDSPVGWSGQGCHVKWLNDSRTECSCNHLTHFAVLMQFDTDSELKTGQSSRLQKKDEKVLNILTYLGLTLSLVGIIATIICYAFLTDIKAPLSQIRISLVASLGVGQIIFLAGIGATENKGVCVTAAALIQYFLMAAFCWMLMEGIYLYLFVVKVYNVSSKMKICHGISWGFPAAMVTLSLSVAAGMDGITSFVSDEFCWISSSNGLIWIFISFVLAIEIINLLILVRVIREMTRMEQTKDNQVEQIRLGIRACVVLIPLLGVTWLFGALSSTHKAFAYIFVIFNSTQGFSIFLLHCVRNSEIRERFKRRIRVIFPAASNGTTSVKRHSDLNGSSSGILSLRKIEVMPISTENLVKSL